MRTPRFAGVLLAFAFATPGLASESIPISNWPAPLLWLPTGVESQEPGDPGAPVSTKREALALPSAPLPFVAVTPCRQYDSRASTPLLQNTPRTVPVIGAPCGIPATAQAVAVNITIFNITGATGNGVFSVGVASPPTTAWINYPPTETQRANAGVVATTDPGEIIVQINQGAGFVDFVVDVSGYYAPVGIVNSLNTLSGDVILAAGANTSITPSAQTLTISSIGTLTGVTAGSGISVTGGAPSPTVLIPPSGIQADRIASGQVVKSVNSAKDDITITGTGGTTVNTVGTTITIATPTQSMVWGTPGDATLIGAGYSEAAPYRVDYWTPTATAGAPTGRTAHTAVWTGTRMIVWGGFDGSNDLDTGRQYDPVGNSWTATSTAAVPSARSSHTAVWTGTKMIVWGGIDLFNYFATGGQYDPVGNSWTATSTTGAPSGRYYHTAVWTGSKMIVWGGYDGFSATNTGGQYDPVGNSWTAMTTTGAPAGRYYHSAVWTGSKMIVWGGVDGISNLATGGQYDPVLNSWTSVATSGAPSARSNHAAVWTGTRMVVWGGNSGINENTGGLYDPVGNSWTATTTTGAPSGRKSHSAVWTGTRMIIWGGVDGINNLATGGEFDAAGNSWMPTVTSGAPLGRYSHTAVWTGTRMIIWGGNGVSYENTGGQWAAASLYVKN